MIIKKEDEGTLDYNKIWKINTTWKTPYLQVIRRRKKKNTHHIFKQTQRKKQQKVTRNFHVIRHSMSSMPCHEPSCATSFMYI